MGDIDRPKVCLDLAGLPVIVRAMETYRRCGIENHVVVVGDRAGEVASTICEHFPQTIFAYQREQRGTGHAARCGAAVLDAFDYTGDVLVVVGDRIMSEEVVRELLARFRESNADLCITVGDKKHTHDAGRVIEDDDGHILANIEVSDVARARLIARWFAWEHVAPLNSDMVRTEMLQAFRTERKAQRAMPHLWRELPYHNVITPELLASCFTPEEAFFRLEKRDGTPWELTADEVEARSPRVNLSVYCFRADALRYALERLTNANAQGEQYLTDSIGILAGARTADGRPQFRVVSYRIANPTDAMTFNTLPELEAIRERYAHIENG